MDALITAAARALAAGDVLGALGKVALRSDPSALALRGIAMARLGELTRARALLRQAQRGFGQEDGVARSRCVVAEAEVALALRDLAGSTAALQTAAQYLEDHHDPANALQAWLVVARHAVLLGRAKVAQEALARLRGAALPPALAAMAGLTQAALALRSLQVEAAYAALQAAAVAAGHSGIPALQAEVAQACAELTRPAARLHMSSGEQMLDLRQVAAVLVGPGCVVDGCRHGVWKDGQWRALARRPLLFAVLSVLAQAWPGDVSREALIADAFRTAHGDDSHRARLRVDIGRLRTLLRGWLVFEATPRGYRVRPADDGALAVLLPPVAGDVAAVAALLADGAAWSSSALALALGTGQRSVQRALSDLLQAGRVHPHGQGRAQRWRALPLSGFTTALLLPPLLPGD